MTSGIKMESLPMGLMDLNGYHQGHKRMPQQQQPMPPFHMPHHNAMSSMIKREFNNTLGLPSVMDASLEQQADLLLSRHQHGIGLKRYQSHNQSNEDEDDDMDNDDEQNEDEGLHDDEDDRCIGDNTNDMLNENNLTAQDLSLPMLSTTMIRNHNQHH